MKEDIGVALAHEDDALVGQLVGQLCGAQQITRASVGDGIQDEVGLLGLAGRVANFHSVGFVDLVTHCRQGRQSYE